MTLQETLYQEYVKNKYERMWNDLTPDAMAAKSKLFDLAKVAITLSDALEALRDKDPRKASIALQLMKYELSDARKDIYRYKSTRHLHTDERVKICDIGEGMLIITEVVEFIRAVLDGDRLEANKELADINIRSYNLASRRGVADLDEIIREKHKVNMQRGKLHGRQI